MGTHLFHILKTRIRLLGGLRLVREYARLGVLWPMVKVMVRNPFRRQSYEDAYAVALRRVEVLLQEKFGPVMRELADCVCNEGTALEHRRSKRIWFCWLQGIEEAPQIVKVCYASLLRHLPDREVVVIDGKNWRDYVELPECVVEKWGKGLIPAAHFSDLLRLQLLIRYGGTWIDSTILCTGFGSEATKVDLGFLHADLFLFQHKAPGSGAAYNSFLRSCGTVRSSAATATPRCRRSFSTRYGHTSSTGRWRYNVINVAKFAIFASKIRTMRANFQKPWNSASAL